MLLLLLLLLLGVGCLWDFGGARVRKSGLPWQQPTGPCLFVENPLVDRLLIITVVASRECCIAPAMPHTWVLACASKPAHRLGSHLPSPSPSLPFPPLPSCLPSLPYQILPER
jgi:hypothetical protein